MKRIMILTIVVILTCFSNSSAMQITGEGYGENQNEARKEALADLSQRIQVEVKSEFSSTESVNAAVAKHLVPIILFIIPPWRCPFVYRVKVLGGVGHVGRLNLEAAAGPVALHAKVIVASRTVQGVEKEHVLVHTTDSRVKGVVAVGAGTYGTDSPWPIGAAVGG